MTLLANINVGSSPNDGTGDSLRTSFITCNENFQILDTLATEFTSGNLNANITSNGTSTFSDIVFTGNITGNGLLLSNIVAETVSNSLQPNITSLGNLTNLTVTGSITSGDISSGNISAPISTITANTLVSTSLNVGTVYATDLYGTLLRTANVQFGTNIATVNINFESNSSYFDLTGVNINSNLTVNIPGTITPGIVRLLSVYNAGGGTNYVLLPGTVKNNKGTNVIAVGTGVTASFTMYSFDSTTSNVVAIVANN